MRCEVVKCCNRGGHIGSAKANIGLLRRWLLSCRQHWVPTWRQRLRFLVIRLAVALVLPHRRSTARCGAAGARAAVCDDLTKRRRIHTAKISHSVARQVVRCSEEDLGGVVVPCYAPWVFGACRCRPLRCMSWAVLGRRRTRSWWAAGSSAFGGRDGVAASRTPRWLNERLARSLNTDERIACIAWRRLEPTSLTLRRRTFVAHAIVVSVVVRLA